ncbi:MAG: EF-hand domain-containing protein [Kiritimatiellales bacterium]
MKKEVIITAVCLMAVTGFSAPRATALFVEIDTNKDGKATLEELDIWFKARAERTGVPLSNPQMAQKHIDVLDADKNGVLTLDEWTANR